MRGLGEILNIHVRRTHATFLAVNVDPAVAHHATEPRAADGSPLLGRTFQGPNVSVLDKIFRSVIIRRQGAREVKGPIPMLEKRLEVTILIVQAQNGYGGDWLDRGDGRRKGLKNRPQR